MEFEGGEQALLESSNTGSDALQCFTEFEDKKEFICLSIGYLQGARTMPPKQARL
jgi:hypothetical protein